MIPGIVGKSIWRASANSILAAGIVLFALACCVGAKQRLFRNFFNGPTPMSVTAITKLGNPDAVDAYWVRTDINGESARLGSIRYTSRNVTKYYVPVRTAAGFLLIESPTATPSGTVEGDLSGYSWFDESAILPRLPEEIRARLLPVTLHRSTVRPAAIAFFILGGGIALYSMWRLATGILCILAPGMHPSCRVLKRFGNPQEIAVAVDAELRAGARKTSSFYLTQSWLLRMGTFSTDLVYLGDVAWVYKRQIRYHAYYVIPVATLSYLMIFDRYGESRQIAMRSGSADELMANIHRAVPWALIGFQPELKREWRKDRKMFLMHVHHRKQVFLEKIKNGEAAKAGGGAEEPVRIIRRRPATENATAAT